MKSLYVANWKMNMSLSKAHNFVHEANLTSWQNHNAQLIICPQFPLIYPIQHAINNTDIAMGAQNCAATESGAYTGEVSATLLAELKCRFTIIGHSERRTIFSETNHDVAQKALQLLAHDIVPIICVGETAQEYQAQQTHQVIEQQLAAICQAIAPLPTIKKIVIAYEPVWAIGTGKTPDNKTISDVCNMIKKYLSTELKNVQQLALLYGGSVDPISAAELKKISLLNGFLIGGASLDFQKFKNIVVC